jgi:ribose-phosphate pyrophosphokinase
MYIVATTHYIPFAQSLATALGGQWLDIERHTFPDGERYHRIAHSPVGQEVVLVGGTIDDPETLELYELACGLIQYGAAALQIVVPYYGYATMERAAKRGEVVKAHTRALLLSAIPHAGRNNRIYLVDLHAEGIPHYFTPPLTATHVYAKPLVLEIAKELGGADFVLAATDAGRAKWVESLANDLDVPAAFVYKRRTSGSETAITGVNADVKGRTVVLYDDMIRTGGSLLQAAQVYKNAGATRIVAIATHLVLPPGTAQKLQASGVFDCIVGTDTHPNGPANASAFLQVRSVVPLLADALTGRHAW